MQVRLDGRTALVTGASRGIGRAIAEGLAEAGARVALHHSGAGDIDTLAHRLGGVAVAADLRRMGAAQALWDTALDALGRVDVLVANAGLFVAAPLDAPDTDWEDAWATTLAVNLHAPAVLLRAAARHAAERRASGEDGVVVRVVTVSSRAAFRGDDPEFLAYAASKGGLVALTKSVARGCAGVAAFGVAPGFTRTDMAADSIAQHGESGVAAGMALDRLTEPGDVAPLVVLLASGLADHATGTTIDVNGASYVR